MSSAFHSADDAAVVARTATKSESVAHYVHGEFIEHHDDIRHGPFVPD